MLEDLKPEINSLKARLDEMGASLDIERKEEKIAELEYKMGEPTFWDDAEYAQKINQELNDVKISVDRYKELVVKLDDVQVMLELGMEDDDDSVEADIKADMEVIDKALEELHLEVLLSGKYDANNCYLTLHAGAGGTEAQDWTSMLLRMYGRWAERRGFTVETEDLLPGDEAGVKSVTLFIKGHNAYGYLKSEKGVHRLVRISPFNAQGKRQTSFVSLDVMPEIDEDIDIEIKDEDIRIDTYRSSGAGGQHINKTSSAIRITHFPTGIVVTCQNERSQFQNKDKAMQMLKAKLYMLQKELNAEKLSDIRGDVKDIGWGNQIRSYVLQPYKMVKDLRTGEESANADAVLDGALDPFINAYLKWLSVGSPDRNIDQ